MTDRELMQQALEALEPYAILYGHIQQVVTALRERLAQPYCDDCGGTDPECPLAQPEQEPVAWMQEMPTKGDETRSVRLTTVEALAREEWPNPIPLYTTPPRREWQGLTEEEKRQLFEREDYQGWLDYINAIEAKLREKNA